MQNKNLKLKLGLCGLALTSFLAVNAHSVVHADTVSDSNANNNAITWDSDSDDSQVVKEEPEQEKVSQSVQNQVPVQSHVQASQSQPVQNKKMMVSDVSSTVRQSNAQTSTVNRLNANKSQTNVKVSNVQDVAQAPVQKQKVAQFNQGSKIYSLNNGPTVSKNNGDGYVITNAGMYNDRAVDIGVTINNVKDNQGSYTTKWSNGDKADVTGKVDNDFSYQNSVLVGSINGQPQVDASRTRTRMANQSVDFPYKILLHHAGFRDGGIQEVFTDDITNSVIANYERNQNVVNGLGVALSDAVISDISSRHGYTVSYAGFSGHQDGSAISTSDELDTFERPDLTDLVPDENYMNRCVSHAGSSGTITALTFSANDYDLDHTTAGTILIGRGNGKYKINKQTPVIDHLQLDHINKGSLDYNYTVGLYDAQTGDLITDLKPEYKSKAGKSATNQDTVMNNAIKAKIQAINANKASVAYTGTVANDDVAFYKETRAVNPQDQALHKSATRIISVNLPNDPAVKDRYKGILNSNNQIVQTINFTRTGVENIVSGQVIYGAWTGPSSFGAVTLPDIPGYTMTMN